MSSAVAHNTYFGVLAWFSDIRLEEFHRVGDLLHQACKGGAHQSDAQASEQL
jgi:hypothetical protein